MKISRALVALSVGTIASVLSVLVGAAAITWPTVVPGTEGVGEKSKELRSGPFTREELGALEKEVRRRIDEDQEKRQQMSGAQAFSEARSGSWAKFASWMPWALAPLALRRRTRTEFLVALIPIPLTVGIGFLLIFEALLCVIAFVAVALFLARWDTGK